MKKILSIFIAAAALFTLASCQKENPEAANNGSAKTARIISGEFANDGTKTTLDTDDKTPLWTAGDKIRVLDGTSYEDITLAAGDITDGGKKMSFTTTLTGETLYAVYPASVTAMTKCTDGNITFTVPAIQDGTFGSANICVASENNDSLYFSNATAVVEMTVADGVVYAQLTASNNITGNMTVAVGNKGKINSTTTDSLSSYYIFVDGAPSGSKYYMAVAPVDAGTVTATCNTSKKSGSVDKGTKTLAKNKIYAMNLSEMTIETEDLTGQHGVLNGQEYVLIKAKYDGTNDSYLKWATQNLAVTESGRAKWNGTNYQIGDYFQWAASYEGYGITAEADKVPANLVIYDSFTTTYTGGSSETIVFKEGKSDGFIKNNAPYYDGTKYTKYTGTGDNKDGKTKLELTDDVARIVLGSTWRMPTGGDSSEFKAMYNATYWALDKTAKVLYVFKPGVGTSGTAGSYSEYGTGDEKTKALLFFPATGLMNTKIFNNCGNNPHYWSSTLHISSNQHAYLMGMSPSYKIDPVTINERRPGMSVRPVSE